MTAYVDFILSHFETLMRSNPEVIGMDVPIPQFTFQAISTVCNKAQWILARQSTLVRDIPSTCYVVGDIRGNIVDLIRIFQHCGHPKDTKYLFLGNYSDKEQFSIETIVLLLAILVKYPQNINLLRGTLEFRKNNAWLMNDCHVYGNAEIYSTLNNLFDYLPLAAIVDNNIFCVHGGVTGACHTLEQIENTPRPIADDANLIVQSLIFPSPDLTITNGPRFSNSTGFGPATTEDFFASTGMRLIIRSNDCVAHGVYECIPGVLTIFSSSSHSQMIGNSGSVVEVQAGTQLMNHTFSPPHYKLRRFNAVFAKHAMEKMPIPNPGRITLGTKVYTRVPVARRSSDLMAIPQAVDLSAHVPEYSPRMKSANIRKSFSNFN